MSNNILKNINEGKPFVLFSWDKIEKTIDYVCISEYGNDDGSEINFSKRGGSIPDEENTTVFDWFYYESFQNDGYLVNTKHYATIADILMEECPVDFFLAKRAKIRGTMRDLTALCSGVYIIFEEETL